MTPRDITMDVIEAFLGRIQSGKVERGRALGHQHAVCEPGRTAIYEKREATWNGEFGSIGQLCP